MNGGERLPSIALPPPRPALLAMVGADNLRWVCLRLLDELTDGELAACFPEAPDEFADLAAEFAELVVAGLADDRPRAALATARLKQRHAPLSLTAGARQVWLDRWAGALRRQGVPVEARPPLWAWMAALTLRWLAAGQPRVAARPLDLYRR